MKIDPTKLAVEMALAKQRHAHQDVLEANETQHIKEIQERNRAIEKLTIKSPAAPSKRFRTNDRTGVMKMAHESATDPSNARSVLAALRALALSKLRPAPLLGYIPDEKSFKWDSGKDELLPIFQNEKDALAAIRRYLASCNKAH